MLVTIGLGNSLSPNWHKPLPKPVITCQEESQESINVEFLSNVFEMAAVFLALMN